MDAQQIAAVFANRKVEEVGPCPWTYPILDETYEEAKSRFGKPNLPVVSEPISYDATGKEIVVVSDLHIASGRTAVGVFRGTENFFADDAFGRFLDHVQSIKETRSMLLVFNGDIFDFLRVTEYPGWRKRVRLVRRMKLRLQGRAIVAPERPTPEDVRMEFAEWSEELTKVGIVRRPDELERSISKTEIRFGLETDDYKTIYRLMRIKRGHPGFFLRLARWMLEGNSILILKGNHDLEICQKNVRQYIELQLAESMAGMPAGAEGGEVGGSGDIASLLEMKVFPKIRFADDSVVIDGDFYLEHGHRYDKFTMVLGKPFLNEKEGQINIPFGSFFNRYLINRVELYYPFFDKVRPAGNIIPMLIRDNFPLALRVIFQQLPFTLRILSTNAKYIWFMINRVIWPVLIIAAPLVTLVWLHWDAVLNFLNKAPGKPFAIVTLLINAAKSVGALLVPYFLARVVSWFQLTEPDSLYSFARHRFRVANGKFRIMTMGHTHNPGEYALGDGRPRFYNTGTWIPVIETSSAEVREDRMYTFLHLRRDSDGLLEVAESRLLQRWNDDAGRAEPQLLIERK
jgi:UDP-2,3-diacylglucosamine pyrophosphatase LpxH